MKKSMDTGVANPVEEKKEIMIGFSLEDAIEILKYVDETNHEIVQEAIMDAIRHDIEQRRAAE